MIKKILIIIVIVSILFNVHFYFTILQDVLLFTSEKATWIYVFLVAVFIQLIGHLFRVKRTKLVIDQAASSGMKFQFATLSMGYLFNALLPLRFGELIRAFLIAKKLHISFLYTFVAIVIERLIDIIFLGMLVIGVALFINGQIAINLIVVATFTVFIAVAILSAILLLKQENKYLLSIISSLSHIFNTVISNSIRFKVWSLIFGLQNFLNNSKLVNQYVIYTAISWTCYLGSTFIIIMPLLSIKDPLSIIIAGVSPYIISLSSIDSPLSVDSYYELATLLPIHIISSNFDLYAKFIWAILVLPMALIGIISLIFYKITNKGMIKEYPNSYTNKLSRYEDISQEFPAFLDTYFRGHSLSKILHKIEVHGELRLVKFFKGGSDAITVLALKNGELFVKKIVPAEYIDRLRTQYQWLKKFANKKSIVDVLAEQKTADYYAIDLSYDPTNISLFEYIHTHSLKQSKQAIDDVWSYVFKHIYSVNSEASHTDKRDVYVQKRLIEKIKQASMVNEDLKEAIKGNLIKINGEVYDNFYTIFEKIKKHKQAWGDIATYRASDAIHGDLTIDNILINTNTHKPFIIDPSDDNQIRGPIIDFARQMQSLVAGYEFLNNDDCPTDLNKENGLISINYIDHRSARYMQLYDYLNEEISKMYLTEVEKKTVPFHVGLLYGRMLSHRVVINPHNTLKYYAVSVVLLNKFYNQYEK